MTGARPRVAVVGAGIGGLAAAVALRREGFPVDVYEQAAGRSADGIGMHLGPNGSRILRHWGLADELRAVAVRPNALEIRNWRDGSLLARQEMGANWEQEFGAPYYTISRADLHRMLAAQVPAGVIHRGRRCVAFTEGDDSVRLSFADGSRADADVLVGADGIGSVVRRAFAGIDEPVLSRTSALRGLAPMDRLPGLAAETMFVWAGPKARLLCYPVDGGRRLTVVAVVPDGMSTVESWSSPATPDELAAAFTDWDPAVRAIVAAVRDVRRWTLCDREPLDRWSTRRVTLLGDAAHPMLPHHGQGANQAIEDGVALATCLAQAGGQVEQGLSQYEDLRRPHTTHVQLGSRGSGMLRMRPTEPNAAQQPASALPSLVDDATWVMRYDVRRELAPLEPATMGS